MLKNLKIQSKILTLAGFLLLNIAGVIFVSVFSMGKIAKELDAIVNKDIPLTKVATQITEDQLEQDVIFERALRYGQTGRIAAFREQVEEFDSLDEAIEIKVVKGRELAKEARAATEDSHLREELDKVLGEIDEIEKSHKLFSEEAGTVFQAIRDGEDEKVRRLEPKVAKIEHKLKEEVKTFLHDVEEFTAAALIKADSHEKDAIRYILGMSAIQIILSIILSVFIGRDIGLRLVRVSQEVEQIAQQNNLGIRLDDSGRDEIASMAGELNGFLEKIGGIMNELRERAESIATSSQGINETSQTLSSGSEELSQQAQSISSASTQMDQNLIVVASAVEEMTTSIAEVTRQAVDAAGVASKANETAESTSKLVVELGQNAERIGVVTDTISQIADQTNLLALNAAIEAAGAGEAGKGFAVVASEVKELARQASEAAEDIKNRVQNVQSNTDQTVSAIEMIAEIISQLNEINSAIASAMEEQSITTREISSNVNQSSKAATEVTGSITNVSEVAGSSARDAARTFELADSLKDLSTRLENIVHQFKFDA